MATIIQITHPDINSGNPVKVLAQTVKISGQKNVNVTPSVNILQMTRALTQSFENPVYSISPVYVTGQAGTLTYNDVIVLYKMRYDNTNAPILNVTYDGDKQLVGVDSGSTDIKVILQDYSFDLNAKESRDAYRPKLSLKFVETR